MKISYTPKCPSYTNCKKPYPCACSACSQYGYCPPSKDYGYSPSATYGYPTTCYKPYPCSCAKCVSYGYGGYGKGHGKGYGGCCKGYGKGQGKGYGGCCKGYGKGCPCAPATVCCKPYPCKCSACKSSSYMCNPPAPVSRYSYSCLPAACCPGGPYNPYGPPCGPYGPYDCCPSPKSSKTKTVYHVHYTTGGRYGEGC